MAARMITRRLFLLSASAAAAAALFLPHRALAQTDTGRPGEPRLSPLETPDSALDSFLSEDTELDPARIRLLTPRERARYREEMDGATTADEKRQVREEYELLIRSRAR